MREPTEIISNITALAAISALVVLVAFAPPAQPGGGPAPAKSEDFTIEAAAPEPEPVKPPEPEPEKKPEPPPPPPPEPEPPQPEPEPVVPPPPPPPPPEETRKPDDKAETPVEMLQDEDGAASKTTALPVASEEITSAFRSCLQKFSVYPTSKEALKRRPAGVVGYRVSVSKGMILSIEITKSSGSPILDQAARSSVLNSGCGSLGESSVVTGTLTYRAD